MKPNTFFIKKGTIYRNLPQTGVFMSDLKSSPRNSILGTISDLVGSARDKANTYQVLPQVPLIGGTGIGELFIGKTPEEINEWAYGNSPFQITGGGTGSYIPQVKTGRQQQLADTVLTGMDVGGLAKLMPKAVGVISKNAFTGHPYGSPLAQMGALDQNKRDFLKKLGQMNRDSAPTQQSAPTPSNVQTESIDQGRRNVLKGLGAGALAATAPMVALKAVKSLPDNVVTHAAEELAPVASRVAAHVAETVIPKFNPQLTLKALREMLADAGSSPSEADLIFANSPQTIADIGHLIDTVPHMDNDLIRQHMASGIQDDVTPDWLTREKALTILSGDERTLDDFLSEYGTGPLLKAAYPEKTLEIEQLNHAFGSAFNGEGDAMHIADMEMRFGDKYKPFNAEEAQRIADDGFDFDTADDGFDFD